SAAPAPGVPPLLGGSLGRIDLLLRECYNGFCNKMPGHCGGVCNMADKVLIVDDDQAICKLLEKVLRSNELDAVTANSGAAALEQLAACRFDLILLDVSLGDMEGFDVIHEIRSRGDTTPVMILS